MHKNRLLLIPFLFGLILLIYSWYLSYPLGANTVSQYIFNDISILYWLSLPLILVPLYLVALTSKNNYKWLISICITITFYSISYFYFMVPGSDSQYFRGMTEYLADSKNLNPLQPNHSYYQWPSFFILTYIASFTSGIGIQYFEFVLYAIIGFLLTIALHFYASQTYKNTGFLMVIAFFISMFYFLNYQCVPFSLALALLFIMFMIETREKSISLTITIELLFIGLVLTHAFVPLFFIIYLLFRTIIDRSKYYGQLFLFALSLFFIIQITLAQNAFASHIMVLLNSSNEYSSIVQATATPASIPIDDLAQLFSRIVTIATVAISGFGFLFLVIKKQLRNVDKAILLTGILYTGLGFFLAALGSRALILVFMPVALGLVWLFEKKINKIAKKLFYLILMISLILFMFIPMHLSFNNAVQYQTQEAYNAENFLIDHTDWAKVPYIFAYSSLTPYIQAKVSIDTHITPYVEEGKNADIIIYTVGLGKDMSLQNYTSQRFVQEESLNIFYNNGFSFVAVKPTW